jgi:hypothetical protein
VALIGRDCGMIAVEIRGTAGSILCGEVPTGEIGEIVPVEEKVLRFMPGDRTVGRHPREGANFS